MITVAAWAVPAVLAGFVIAYPVLRRYPVLLWPSGWLPAIRLRRQRRKMTDPSDRTGS